MENKWVRENERIDDLQVKGLKIIQNPNGFCFGIDAVLLANFSIVKRGAKVVDLGTGTGIIPLLIAGKSRAAQVTGIEIQEEVAKMAQRSVFMNGLEDRVSVLHKDLKETLSCFEKQTIDVVTSNPPYMPAGKGLTNPGDKKAISRHEITCTLDDVVRTAKDLLKIGGQFFMIHRPNRLVDILASCRAHKLEPKRIRFVHPHADKRPNMVLVHCVKGGKPEVQVLEPLVVYKADGTYTDEIHAIYGRESIEPTPGGRR